MICELIYNKPVGRGYYEVLLYYPEHGIYLLNKKCVVGRNKNKTKRWRWNSSHDSIESIYKVEKEMIEISLHKENPLINKAKLIKKLGLKLLNMK